MTAGDLSAVRKKEPTTTRRPASGPTERSMPPVISTMVCPMAMKPSAAHDVMTEVMLKGAR